MTQTNAEQTDLLRIINFQLHAFKIPTKQTNIAGTSMYLANSHKHPPSKASLNPPPEPAPCRFCLNDLLTLHGFFGALDLCLFISYIRRSSSVLNLISSTSFARRCLSLFLDIVDPLYYFHVPVLGSYLPCPASGSVLSVDLFFPSERFLALVAIKDIKTITSKHIDTIVTIFISSFSFA